MLFFLLFTLAESHGLLSHPRQRGALNLPNHPIPILDVTAPTDYEAHFPAGSKSTIPRSGTDSLILAAGGIWTPYNPYDTNFRWRAGVCGDDLQSTQDHLLGGRYYHHGAPVVTWSQGQVIFFQVEVVAHHNGFFEFHICNLDTCGGDISTKCFIEGHCQPLHRVTCDRRQHCAPIDRMNPWRWYLHCRHSEPELMGGPTGTILYALPPDLTCERCVVQWYWTSANACNPPGVMEYFTGPDRPHWGDCPGQGGAIGGWARNKPTCGGSLFPEEYFQCADVRISPNVPQNRPPQSPHPPTPPMAPRPPPGFHGPQPPPPPSPPQAPQSVAVESGEGVEISVSGGDTSEGGSEEVMENAEIVENAGSEDVQAHPEEPQPPVQDTGSVTTEDHNSGDGSEGNNFEDEQDTASSFGQTNAASALGIHHSQF